MESQDEGDGPSRTNFFFHWYMYVRSTLTSYDKQVIIRIKVEGETTKRETSFINCSMRLSTHRWLPQVPQNLIHSASALNRSIVVTKTVPCAAGLPPFPRSAPLAGVSTTPWHLRHCRSLLLPVQDAETGLKIRCRFVRPSPLTSMAPQPSPSADAIVVSLSSSSTNARTFLG